MKKRKKLSQTKKLRARKYTGRLTKDASSTSEHMRTPQREVEKKNLE